MKFKGLYKRNVNNSVDYAIKRLKEIQLAIEKLDGIERDAQSSKQLLAQEQAQLVEFLKSYKAAVKYIPIAVVENKDKK